jgi:iron complex outermembrane receptor protein
LNQAFLGGVTLFSVGGRYAVNNMVWQLNVDNAADKRTGLAPARAWRPVRRV